jgi:putative FmdB family regulatory protein
MPSYDFECPNCGHVREITCKMSEIEEKAKLTVCDECYINNDQEIIMKKIMSQPTLINPGGLVGKGLQGRGKHRNIPNAAQEFSKDGDTNRSWQENVKVKKND